MRFIGVYDYTVILTYLSLFSAFGGMTFASRGMFTAAIAGIMAVGILLVSTSVRLHTTWKSQKIK